MACYLVTLTRFPYCNVTVVLVSSTLTNASQCSISDLRSKVTVTVVAFLLIAVNESSSRKFMWMVETV
jgi:hypothetical protein